MILSKIKPATVTLTIFSILLASLSRSVCGSEIQQRQQHPLNRDYIKTPDGSRRADEVAYVVCRLWEKSRISHGVSPDSNLWECSFDDLGTSMDVGGFSKKAIVGIDDENLNEWLVHKGAESATTLLVLSEAEVLTDRIIIDKENFIAIEESHHDSINRRRLETDVRNTLVVRVNALDNSPPDAVTLSQDIFNDEYCLKSHYDRCSFGKLQIEEYVQGTISDLPTFSDAPGVADIFVNVNAEGASVTEFQDLAETALKNALNMTEANENPGDIFDLVMYCMPPGMATDSGDWDSYSYISGYSSFFNNEDCRYMSIQMQLVGQNLGLHHAGIYSEDELEAEFGDTTGLMGFTYDSDDGPAMCFNPANNWVLGWYQDKDVQIDIMSEISNEATSFTLNGVVDYDDASADGYIVVKIADFYIGFNRAESFNSGVQEAANQVTIVEMLGDSAYPKKTKLVSALSVGDTYTIALNGLVLVNVEYVSNSEVEAGSGRDAVIEIKYANEPVVCEGEADAEVEVVISTDRWYDETSWGIADSNGHYVYLSDKLTYAGLHATTVGGLCRGHAYDFVAMDSYGDGFCCDFAAGDDGTYSVKYNGEELFGGEGSFERLEVKSFVLPFDSPTSSPTLAPTASPTIDCDDNPNKKFDIDVNGTVKTKDCEWLASKKKKKRKEYCKMKVEVNGNTKKLPAICKDTCGRVGKGKCSFLKGTRL